MDWLGRFEMLCGLCLLGAVAVVWLLARDW
jgi:hypothetical protein